MGNVTTPAFRTDPETFDELYRGEPVFEGGPAPTGVPWDVHQAQPRLMELEALGGFSGEVLDIGCGLGDNAIYLASRGHSATGLDGSPAAIEEARRRAADAGVTVTFDVADATDLSGYEGRFDTVVDSALYHCLDDDRRQAYIAALYRATRPGARLHLADQMPPEALEQMREVTERFAKIADLLDDDRVYLPFTVVHAHRVD